MCGIGGFFGSKRQVSDLYKINDAQKHRGPNASGTFYDEGEGIGLAHVRLSVLDLHESANQPMYSQDERYVVCFNGEIYNFKELKEELDYPFKTQGDTEVILAAFMAYGPRMVEKFNGMFAIALYDQQLKELFLFRDRLGIKPLFYTEKEGEIIFASELKAITAIVKNALSINKDIVREYLHLGYISEPNTIWNEVKKFPAGSWAKVTSSGLEIERYWSSNAKINSITISDESTAIKELETTLKKSVERRMISDVPLGTFLSGGIDSSLVTNFATQVSSQKVKTFSIGFEENEKNEAPFARAISEHLQTDHHEFIVSQNEIKNRIRDIVTSYDEPYADSSAYPTMIVSELARKHVTVTLSGDGGDELFQGYGAYNWAERLNSKKIRAAKKVLGGALSFGNDRQRRAAGLFKYRKDDSLHAHIFSQEQYLFSAKEIEELTNSDYHFQWSMPNVMRGLSPSEEQAFFDLNYYLKDDLLTKVDRASMKYNLETRVPLLDHEVVELALNIDKSLKIKGSSQKYLLKQLLYKHVPSQLYDRPKSGFSIPLNKWLLSDLSYLIDEYITKENLEAVGISNYVMVEKIIKDYRNGRNYFYNRIWLLVVLAMWYKNNE